MINLIKILKKAYKYSIKNWRFLVALITACGLRFLNLGYSDYQGDEIKALYLPEPGENFTTFLMDQRKGPVQFFITYLLKFINPTYDNQFLMRFLFALAGFFSVYFFFKFVKRHFGEKIAFYASMFLATNGFFVAFSRIVQYQSFVILFMILALYMFTLAVQEEKYKFKGVYLGFIFWALSILSHYDAVFIAPFALYLFVLWFKKKDITKKQKIIHLGLSLLLSGGMLASFYIPFVLSLSQSTMDYWSGRISGAVSSKISSSRYLFTVYQPIYVIHIYTVLCVFGIIFLLIGHFSRLLKLVEKLPKFVQKLFKPTTQIMLMVKEDKLKMWGLFGWIGLAVAFYEGFVYIPGTHIYVYLLPLFIVLAFGIVMLESIVQRVFELKLVKVYNTIGIAIMFAFIIAQTHAVFVEHRQEYPWKNEKFMLWTLSKPTPIYHLSMFGFPYYKDWEGISQFVAQIPDLEGYSTNERKSIVRYYVPLPKSSDEAGVYIYVKDPQSFTNEIVNKKPAYWVEHYEPIFTFSKNGSDQVRVYLMEKGSLEEIIEKGF